jgi:[ribosomal protein S5]-alanine N-acetyltransferase
MNPIYTSRLLLLPLTPDQLRNIVVQPEALQHSLGLSTKPFRLSADDSFMKMFDEAVLSFIIPQTEINPQEAQWFTHWLIIDREQNERVGGIGAGGSPANSGTTQIGYFVSASAENNGVASEAVAAFTEHLFSDPRLNQINAFTLPEGKASQRVLEKNGFVFGSSIDGEMKWTFKRK